MFSNRKARGQFAGRPVVTDRESRRTIAGLCPDPRFVSAAPGGFRRIPCLEKGNGPLFWYRLILPIRFDILVQQAPLPAFLKRAGVTQG